DVLARLGFVRKRSSEKQPAWRKRRGYNIEPLEPRQMLSASWTGGGHSSGHDNWNYAQNWSGNSVPTGGALSFPSTAAYTNTVNDVSANTEFSSITISGNNFSLGGNAVKLTAGVSVASGVTGAVISLPIVLDGSNAFNVNSNLTDSGVISGGNSTGDSLTVS